LVRSRLAPSAHRARSQCWQAQERINAAAYPGEFAAQTRVASTSRTAVPRGSQNRIAAAAILLDRGWGKAKEMQEHQHEDGQSLMKVVREFVHVNVDADEVSATDEEPVLIEWRGVRDGNGSNGHEH
jgi:hypothetical protein